MSGEAIIGLKAQQTGGKWGRAPFKPQTKAQRKHR